MEPFFSSRALSRFAAAAFSSLAPVALHACAVCALPSTENGGAYSAMTIFMSALPLTMVGGLAYFLWKRY